MRRLDVHTLLRSDFTFFCRRVSTIKAITITVSSSCVAVCGVAVWQCVAWLFYGVCLCVCVSEWMTRNYLAIKNGKRKWKCVFREKYLKRYWRAKRKPCHLILSMAGTQWQAWHTVDRGKNSWTHNVNECGWIEAAKRIIEIIAGAICTKLFNWTVDQSGSQHSTRHHIIWLQSFHSFSQSTRQ